MLKLKTGKNPSYGYRDDATIRKKVLVLFVKSMSIEWIEIEVIRIYFTANEGLIIGIFYEIIIWIRNLITKKRNLNFLFLESIK